MRTLYYDETRGGGYIHSMLMLLGHLLGTAVIFLAFALLIWVVSFLLSWLNGWHPFPVAILNFITLVEVGVMYVDAAMCGFIILAGTVRFIKDLLR